jgi:hypothetical protein
VAAAGQLVTVFALTYAFSSPILTALTGALNRHQTPIRCRSPQSRNWQQFRWSSG